MPGRDRSMNGIDDALGHFFRCCLDIIFGHPALEVRAQGFLYLAQNQLHGYGNPVLFIEVDGAGCQSQGFHQGQDTGTEHPPLVGLHDG